MSTPKPRITIVGLGLIGSSLGLAIREAGAAAIVTGHDRERAVSVRAEKLGAVDRTDWNLVSACEEANLIILAIPLTAIEGTLRALGPCLRPGSVVMDTASLKEPVLAWAGELLPRQVHFVGTNPILSPSARGQGGVEAARADLFQNGLFCIVPSPTADSAAVRLVTDLTSIVGAKPLFFDAVEHDGQVAVVEHLPAVLALALLETAIEQPTWRELRKVAGPAFGTATELIGADPAALSNLCHANRTNIIRWVDVFAASLASIRRSLSQDSPEELTGRCRSALEERHKWLLDQQAGQWQEEPQPEMPSRGFMESFFGALWPKARKREEP